MDEDGTEVLGTSAEFEVIEQNRRYMLGATGDFYGVWDKEGPEGPLQRFPAEDDGYAQAELLFRQLTRIDRKEREAWRGWLGWSVGLGIAVWVGLGVVSFVYYVAEWQLPFSDWLFAIGVVAFRVWVGGLGALLLIALYRPRTGKSGRPRARETVLGFVLERSLALGLLAWIVGGIAATVRLVPDPFQPGTFGQAEPTAWDRIFLAVENHGYQIAVASFAGLIVIWARAWLSSGGEPAEGEEPTGGSS
ncbi:MAG: hypothetical protein WD770_08365 [Actinomycetota bacterium]